MRSPAPAASGTGRRPFAPAVRGTRQGVTPAVADETGSVTVPADHVRPEVVRERCDRERGRPLGRDDDRDVRPGQVEEPGGVERLPEFEEREMSPERGERPLRRRGGERRAERRDGPRQRLRVGGSCHRPGGALVERADADPDGRLPAEVDDGVDPVVADRQRAGAGDLQLHRRGRHFEVVRTVGERHSLPAGRLDDRPPGTVADDGAGELRQHQRPGFDGEREADREPEPLAVDGRGVAAPSASTSDSGRNRSGSGFISAPTPSRRTRGGASVVRGRNPHAAGVRSGRRTADATRSRGRRRPRADSGRGRDRGPPAPRSSTAAGTVPPRARRARTRRAAPVRGPTPTRGRSRRRQPSSG